LPWARRASDSPIAIACEGVVTFLAERPARNLPRFISCMLRSTFSDAFAPYFLFAFLAIFQGEKQQACQTHVVANRCIRWAVAACALVALGMTYRRELEARVALARTDNGDRAWG
jgi:hypothetical protein